MNKKQFSLIELLVVVGIMGVLSLLILPMFSGTESTSKKAIVDNEMRLIRKRFLRFYADNALSIAETKIILDEGAWPLFSKTKPTDSSSVTFTAYNPEYQTGWRGPYLENETLASSPAVLDPWKNRYQFVVPAVMTTHEQRKQVRLVSMGVDGILNTSAGATVASGDDIMTNLFID